MSDPDLIAAQRETLIEVAQEVERGFLDEVQNKTVLELYRKIKQGMKARALLESKLGESLVNACVDRIIAACDEWIGEDDPEKIAVLRLEARGAMAALRFLDDVMVVAPDAELQLRNIELEIGES